MLPDLDGDGYTVEAGDCDDGDSTVYPGAVEICDGKDNNCDGRIPGTEIDDDWDGYSECGSDCNDSNYNINPGRMEQMCNGIDDNCNGMGDDDRYQR
eukprot:1851559-Rhodomonas_salina.1